MLFNTRFLLPRFSNLIAALLIVAIGLTAGAGEVFADITIFHVNDTHARVTPHQWIVPQHGTNPPAFETVGGAAYLASELLQLTAAAPDSLVIDAGDISEGNPIGDMNGNGSMTQFYTLLSAKLRAQRGRGIDALVVGNHDVRDVNYINNLVSLATSSVPVISVNVRDKNTHQPYFAPYTIVTINGKKIGILGYTTQAAEVGASLASTIEVAACDWKSTDAAKIHLADYVNDLRINQGCDLVILAAHIGHSGLVDPAAPLLVDDGAAKLPEVAVTGHWHTWTDTVWQPEMLNYKTIFTESASYMKYIGELRVTDAGGYLSSTQHLVHAADLTPDPDVEAFLDYLTAQYNTAHPGQPVDEVIGYTADNLMLDNVMKWWSADEYPWSGNNTAGQWICDAMQWKATQLFGQCDLAFETGGGVRADIPAGPVTYLQIYETFPWNDDTFSRVNMTGQEIVNFLRQTNMNAGFSSALDVTAFDGAPASVLFNGAPIDLNHTYTVAINNYMYAHPPTGWTWSDTNPLTSTVLCRDGIVDYMRQFTADNPYHVGGPRYHLNTEFSGGYRAVVMMMNDNDTKPSYEDAFIRMLSATPETLARRGSNQVPVDLVNADGTVNAGNRLSENELYRSYLGFKTGVLHPGDIIETWGKGSSYGGDPEFVDQEGIYSDGVEFKIVGHDDSLAKPVFMSSIGAFWNDNYKNHFVQFVAQKTGTSTVKDQYGTSISIMDATAYTAKTLPGNVNDMLLISGVPTMESYGLRFRCSSAATTTAAFPPNSGPLSHVDPVSSGATSSTLGLSATAVVGSPTYALSPVADSYVASGRATSNYGTSTSLYVQSSSVSTYGNERSWLRFDLSSIPTGANITGANLQLWDWRAAGAALPTEVRSGLTDTWTETGINWNNQPAFGDQLSTQILAAGTLNVWYNWDVTSFAQAKWAGNKLVSLVVKPVTEGSPDATAPAYTFDSKEYSSSRPVLQVTTSGGTGTVSVVEFFYRYSSDNATWGPWTSAGTASTSPYSMNFTYPQGYGYYEFFSRATDNLGNVEPAPTGAQASVHYAAAPAYSTEAIVRLGSLSQIFDGAPKPASVSTIPPSLGMSVTYNGAATIPVNAGTYTVSATMTQPGYTGSATGTLVIAKAAAGVTLGNLSQTYDGSSKSVTVTTNPAGLLVTVTYNGSPAAPTSAGTYSVVATVNDPNYQGSAAGTMTIAVTGAESVPALGLWVFIGGAIGMGGYLTRRRRY
jgi:2',3'-cyclic-nucleotide 2'-phosphodiesterase (5'-nucleotidase family)